MVRARPPLLRLGLVPGRRGAAAPAVAASTCNACARAGWPPCNDKLGAEGSSTWKLDAAAISCVENGAADPAEVAAADAAGGR